MQHRAQDIHFLVSDTFAKGKPHWPVSRANLRGLTLLEVGDAIKMFTAIVYRDSGNGTIPPTVYVTLKKNWTELYLAIPTAFLRIEDWDSAQKIADPAERRTAMLVAGAKFFSKSQRNDEENEFFEAESYATFVNYLETLPRGYKGLIPHVLGHLSQRNVYTETTGAVIP